jgi:hypothetical protein
MNGGSCLVILACLSIYLGLPALVGIILFHWILGISSYVWAIILGLLFIPFCAIIEGIVNDIWSRMKERKWPSN